MPPTREQRYVPMGRIRTVKPEMFVHERLFDSERETELPLRLAYIGLWTCCDREGRFYWRPRQLKLRVLPWDEVDFARVLDALRARGFIVAYEMGGERYGFIPSWHRHQTVNNREQASVIPSPTQDSIRTADPQGQFPFEWFDSSDASPTCAPRVLDASSENDISLVHAQAEGEGEGEGELSTTIKTINSMVPERAAAVERLPLTDGSEYQISDKLVAEYGRLYPGVDLVQEVRKMRGWLKSNPKKGKTKRGILRFINTWLSSEQDRGPRHRPAQVQSNQSEESPLEHEPLPPNLDEAAGHDAWNKAQPELRKHINAHTYSTWIRPLKTAGRLNGTLYLLVPRPEFREQFRWRTEALQALAPSAVKDLKLVY